MALRGQARRSARMSRPMAAARAKGRQLPRTPTAAAAAAAMVGRALQATTARNHRAVCRRHPLRLMASPARGLAGSMPKAKAGNMAAARAAAPIRAARGRLAAVQSLGVGAAPQAARSRRPRPARNPTEALAAPHKSMSLATPRQAGRLARRARARMAATARPAIRPKGAKAAVGVLAIMLRPQAMVAMAASAAGGGGGGGGGTSTGGNGGTGGAGCVYVFTW
jgi:hypothetical protein